MPVRPTPMIVLIKDNVVCASRLENQPNTAILQLLLKSLPTVALIIFDHELCCLGAEGLLLDTVGVRNERIGQMLYEVLPPLAPSAGHWSQFEPFFRSALLGQALSFDIRHTGGDLLANVFPVRDEDNRLNAGVIVLQDMTAPNQMEVALRTSEERYRLLVENYLDAVLLASTDGQLSMANEEACALFNYTANELCAMNVADLLDGADERTAKALATLREGNAFRGELRCLRADRTPFPVEFSGKVYYVTEDAPSLLIVIRDLTEVKQAELQTIELRLQKERVRLLTDFIRDVSHDFRTPLAIIQNSAYLMTRVGEVDKQKTYQEKIVKQVNRLESILTDMITMLRLDTKDSVAMFPVQVNTLLRDGVEQLSHPIKEKRLNIDFQLADSLPVLHGDPNDLDRAFMSIIDNAVRFTPEEGSITLKTRLATYPAPTSDAPTILVEIHDTGIGVPANELPYIFHPFYRADKARSAQNGGVGLGLSIALRIVELHQGRIEVESLEGQGSTFRIHLPVTYQPGQLPSAN